MKKSILTIALLTISAASYADPIIKQTTPELLISGSGSINATLTIKLISGPVSIMNTPPAKAGGFMLRLKAGHFA